MCSSSTSSKTIRVYTCIVCMDKYNINGSSAGINTNACVHLICPACYRSYLNNILERPGLDCSEPIQCASPSCNATFPSTTDALKQVFSKDEVNIWWNEALIKTYIAIKIYCPMRGCQAVYDVDRAFVTRCTFTECYECRKGFCIACQTPWHPEITESYAIRDTQEETNRTLKLAESNRWTRCPKCLHMVEMKDGCNNVQCICGRRFCYGCGRGSEVCIGNCYNLGHDSLNQMRKSMFVSQTQ